jgi:DNA-binding beta-propeller fold protein YncE
MQARVRLATVFAVCCVAALAIWCVWPDQGSSSSAISSGFSTGSVQNASLALRKMSLNSLLAPDVQPEEEGQQAAHERLALSRSTPAARAASRTKYAHLGTARAAKVAREVFPEAIERPAGGLPPTPAGTRVLRYVAANAAQLELPGGKHAVVESLEPMALETSPGHRAPVDLSLTRRGSVFESVRPAVGVLIPRRLRDGVQLPEGGVSLTPVNAQGTPLGGSDGAVDGASVLYANTQTDADTVVKPTTGGVEADTMLRSVNSPEQLYFRVGLSKGASLVQAQRGSGFVKVVEAGRTIAFVLPPSATDAAGVSVPVSMSTKGDLLVLSVAAHSGEHQWPIAVDPELQTVTDGVLGETKLGTGNVSNWIVKANQESKFALAWFYPGGVEMYNRSSIGVAEYASAQYHTQGESKIYMLEAESAGLVTNGRALIQMIHESGVEQSSLLAERTNYNRTKTILCGTPPECPFSGGGRGNEAWYRIEATVPAETDTVAGALLSAHVFIAQENAPTVTFNESEGVIDSGRANVLYGSEHGTGDPQAWLGPNSGAFEVKAHDPGIGVSSMQVAFGEWSQQFPIYEEGKCLGVQCKEDFSTTLTYNPAMPDGEHNIEVQARNLVGGAGLLGSGSQLVKVDATPPYNLAVSGWPSSREILAAPHQLTVEATDGTAPTASSGMRSISVSVDGGPKSGVPGLACGSEQCTHGPVTAKGKWTLNAENLTEGVHRLIVTATDNAGNEAAKEFTFDVRHGSQVGAGPGTVDPTTGQFKLSTTDVSLAGAGQVSRAYESRNLAAGAEGPLGSQWAIGLSGGEGLTVLPTGSVALTGSAGDVTTFTRNEKGEFESPLGDGNLKVEAKEKILGKGITEYLLTDTPARTTTTFTQPTGTSSTLPIYTNQFGGEGLLSHPTGVATDAKGNVWMVDQAHSRVVEFSRAGTLVAAYGSKGSGPAAFELPYGIAINQSTGNVYVSDESNHRIVELNSSGAFVAAFGWGVSNGKEEFEVCTSLCGIGLNGSGNGEFNMPMGVAVDSSGNVWVVDAGDNRVQEFNASGAYLQKFGTEGGGACQFRHPVGIAVFAEVLYITDSGNNRVEDLTPTGGYIFQFGTEGSGNGEFKGPEGIAVDQNTGKTYVADVGNNRVQEFDAKGTMVAKFGSAGAQGGQFSAPKGVAVGSAGAVYVTDYNNNRVQQWAHPLWSPTIAEGPLKSATTTYSYEVVEVEAGKSVIEPTEALAPVSPGVSCGTTPSELKKGCRALTFTYATSTTATGTSPSQWGEYKGDLAQVKFHAWDPAKGAMTEPAVAQYQYDNKGRLRAEWDPRIATALKTIYGYDEEGHVTSVSPPGQEPWLLHYGTLAGDPNTGRLLSVTRPAAASATVLKEQKAMGAPANTAAPALSSTSPVVGTTLSVSGNGTWSNTPLAYSYQWYDCNSSNLEIAKCSAIMGATNKSFTPQISDAGYYLIGKVSATNATATTVASTAASSSVKSTAPTFSIVFGKKGAGKGEINYEEQEAVDAKGNVWVADYLGNRLEEFSGEGTFIKAVGYGVIDGKSEFETCTTTCVTGISGSHHGQFSGPFGIAINRSTGNIYVSDQSPRVQMLDENGKYVSEFGSAGTSNGQFGAGLAGVAVDSLGNVWVADFGNNRVQEFSATGAFLMAFGSAGTGNGQFANPVDIAFSGEYVYVVDYNNNRVQQFTTAGAYVGQWGKKGTLQGEFEKPYAIATEPVSGDLYVSDAGNNRVQAFNPSGGNVTTFGTSGTGNGQFTLPTGLAFDATGRVYVEDNGNGRVERWNPAYSTNNPLPAPPAVESNSITTFEYHVPVSGTGLPNLTEGEVAKWGQTDVPVEAMAVFPPDKPMGWPAKEYERATVNYMDSHGRTVNVSSPSGGISTTEYNELNEVTRTLSADNRVVALGEAGKTVEASKKLDTQSAYSLGRLTETLGPEHAVRLAIGKEGKLNEEASARDHVKYFYDEGAPEGKIYGLVTKTVDGAQLANKEEFDKRTTVKSYGGQGELGWKLREPTSVTTDPGGLNLTSITRYDENSEHESTGNVVETKSPGGRGSESIHALVYTAQFGVLGSGEGQLSGPAGAAVDGAGDVWVADSSNNRIEEFSASGAFMAAYGTEGSGNGQFKHPWGIAVNKAAGDVYVSDQTNNRVEEFEVSNGKFVRAFGEFGTTGGKFNSPNGVAVDASGNVWVADYGNNRVEEFSSTGTFTAAYGSEGTGNGQFKGPKGMAADSAGNVYVTDFLNNRVQELSSAGAYVSQFGSTGSGNGQFSGPVTVAVSPNSGDILVTDQGNNRVQEFSPAHAYLTQFGTSGTGNGQFAHPGGIAVNASDYAYVIDVNNNRIERWAPESNGNIQAHDVKTFYYTAEGESPITACRNHPEWANLPCQTEPVAQPGVSGLPELPVTTIASYNMWDEVLETAEKFGSTSRKKIQTYDAAGRALTSEETSTIDTALPKVTNEYNAETGALEKQSTTTGEVTKSITNMANTLGQMVKYTDADGSLSTYTYETGGDGRLTEVSIGGKGTQTYAYSPTTGFMNKLVDSAAGTFTATYDVEGKMLTEGFPNAMIAKDTYNQVGTATGIEYSKTSHCKTTCPETWFSDTVVPSVHGETLKQTSTLAEEPSYTYDAAGRLTQVQEAPAGKGCKTRVYAYDEESNRTGLATSEPNAEGKCATEGGVLQAHAYDSVNRLIDAGLIYEAFGNATKMPASDSGEYALTNSYYVDNQIASQTQNGETISYYYDPTGRTRETVSSGKTASTVILHYGGPGELLAWTSETSEKWTRNISGPDGALDAIQKSGEAPVLQLHDLQGDIVATAAVSEPETKLLSSYNSTEFGVPTTSSPPKYSWLGAIGVSSELSSSSASGVATQGGASYVPEIARGLQTAPVIPPGAFPNGQGTGEQYGAEIPGWSTALANEESAATLAEYAARQEAERREQEEAEGSEEAVGSEIDPGGCVGKGGLDEVNGFESRSSLPHLNIKCHHADPDAVLAICIINLNTGHWTCGKWHKIGTSYDNGLEFALAVWGFGECESESVYQIAFGYFRIPMKEAEWHYGKEEKCHPDGKEYEKKAFEESAPTG